MRPAQQAQTGTEKAVADNSVYSRQLSQTGSSLLAPTCCCCCCLSQHLNFSSPGPGEGSLSQPTLGSPGPWAGGRGCTQQARGGFPCPLCLLQVPAGSGSGQAPGAAPALIWPARSSEGTKGQASKQLGPHTDRTSTPCLEGRVWERVSRPNSGHRHLPVLPAP